MDHVPVVVASARQPGLEKEHGFRPNDVGERAFVGRDLAAPRRHESVLDRFDEHIVEAVQGLGAACAAAAQTS